MTTVVELSALPFASFSRELIGEEHGAGVSLIFVDAPPGAGVSAHRHAYEEVFVVQDGRATFTVDAEELEVAAGEILVVPAGVTHAFRNSGAGPLRQVDIHVSPRFVTEWLER